MSAVACALVGEQLDWCLDRAKLLLAQQADFSVLWSLCERLQTVGRKQEVKNAHF